jgi:hypothetical protein
MNVKYEVLSPWAEADPVLLRGLSPRLQDLSGKKIGLFSITWKRASALINKMVEKKLKEKFPTAEFSYFDYPVVAGDIEEGQGLQEFENWLKKMDAVVGAVGD